MKLFTKVIFLLSVIFLIPNFLYISSFFGINIIPKDLLSILIDKSNFNLITTYSVLNILFLTGIILLSINQRLNESISKLIYSGEPQYQFTSINSGAYVFISIIIGMLFFLIFLSSSILEWATTGEINSIIRLSRSDFINNDFYTNAVASSPKFIFHKFIYLLSFLGLGWSKALFLLKLLGVLCINALLFLFFVRASRFWNKEIYYEFEEEIKSFVILLLTFQLLMSQLPPYVSPFGWSTDIQFYFAADPMRLSFLSGLAFLILCFSDKLLLIPRLIVLFFSSIVHPVVGICTFLLAAILVLSKSFERARIIEFTALLFISVITPLFLLSYFFDQGNYLSANEFYNIYIDLRHPHHYKLSFILNSHSLFWMMLLILHVLIALYSNNKALIYLTFTTLFLIIFSVLGQYIFSEVFPFKPIMKAGPNRITAYLSIIWSLNSLILILFFLGSPFSQRLKDNFLFKLLLTASYLVNLMLKTFKPFFDKSWLISLSIILIVSSFIFATYQEPKESFKDDKALEALDWLKLNTPEGSIVFSNQLDSALIRIFAERPVYADYMFPFKEEFIKEFAERYSFYISSESFSLSDLACYYGDKFDYIIMKKTTDSIKPQFENDDWAIFDLTKLKCFD